MTKNKIIAETVGKNIKHYRMVKGWKQDELGILAFGYDSNTKKGRSAAHSRISKFETGIKEPSATELVILASTLGIEFKQFFDLSIKILPKSKKIPSMPIAKSADHS